MSSTATALADPTAPTTDERAAHAPICADDSPDVGLGADLSASGALAAACAAGSVALYRRRRTGTARRVPYLAPGTAAREVADWMADRREDGASVAALACEAGCSRVTVRRTLAALDLAYAVEDGDLDDLYGPDVVALVVAGDEDAE